MWGGHEGMRDGAGPQLHLHRDDSTPLRRRRSIHQRPAEHARWVVGSIHTPYLIPIVVVVSGKKKLGLPIAEVHTRTTHLRTDYTRASVCL